MPSRSRPRRARSGVVAVCAGTVHGALDVQKVHTYRLDAFDSGDAGPVAYVEEGARASAQELARGAADATRVRFDLIADAADAGRASRS